MRMKWEDKRARNRFKEQTKMLAKFTYSFISIYQMRIVALLDYNFVGIFFHE